jgi:putative hydrolase of HD superfamily
MGIHKYFKSFSDLEGIIRCPGKFKYQGHSQVEESMIKNFLDREFPVEFREIYERRFSEGKDNTVEGKILAVSDKIDLLYESFGEIQRGNPEPLFVQIYQEALETILQFKDMYCVQYFIENILKEIIEKEITPNTRIQEISKKILAKQS